MGVIIMNLLIVSSNKGTGGVAQSTEDLTNSLNSYEHITASSYYISTGITNFFRSIKNLYSHRGKYDITILMHFKPILLGVILSIISHQKNIYVIHTDLFGYYQKSSFIKKIIVKFMTFFIRKQCVVFVSKDSENRAKKFFKLKNTQTIYNIMNDIKTSGVTPLNQKTTFTLGIVSRLNESKNIDLLIKAFDLCTINIENIDIRLNIYGDGPEKDNIKKYIKNFQSHNKIKLFGYTDNKTTIYESIDALASFSSIEGLPLVILEALSYKIPVIHTDCNCGPREILLPNPSDLITNAELYIQTKYGFLIKEIQDNHKYYNLETTQQDLKYSHALSEFIKYFYKKPPENYDPILFSQSYVTKQWDNCLQSALLEK